MKKLHKNTVSYWFLSNNLNVLEMYIQIKKKDKGKETNKQTNWVKRFFCVKE